MTTMREVTEITTAPKTGDLPTMSADLQQALGELKTELEKPDLSDAEAVRRALSVLRLVAIRFVTEG